MSFYEELKRRNVARVAVLYVIASWLLLQVTDVLSSLLTVPEWTGSLVVLLLLLGFFPVMIFSWVYELTPEGLKREKDIDRSQSISPETGRKINTLIIVLLVLAIAAVVVDRLMPETTTVAETSLIETAGQIEATDPTSVPEKKIAPISDRSIAVLPFNNMSDDPANEYFSDGVTEEILNLLSQIPELRVTSRSSAFAYKGKEIHIPDVAARLNVAHILEGSVRKANNRVRITAQLIDARTDTHLWSETFDHTLEDIFAVQDEIALAVSTAMKLELLDGPPTTVVTDTEAHEYYLQGVHFYNKRTEADYEKAIEYLKKALKTDPDYVPALRTLSATYMIRASSGFMPYDKGYALAREGTVQALRIDPDNFVTHLLRGWIAMMYEHDYAAAAVHYRRALELQPNADVTLSNSAAFALVIGRQKVSIELFRRSTKVDPATPVPYVNLAQLYNGLGELDEAESAARKALELNPDVIGAPSQLAITSLLRGDPEHALALAAGIRLEMMEGVVRAIALYELGNIDESNRVLQALIDNNADQWAYFIAMVHAWRNEDDQAFQWLERAIDENQNLDALKTEALFKNLYGKPRWEETLTKAGLSESQLGAIEFEVTLPE
jgi:TolB-like protein/Flp pilus assembly protein TadD